MTLQMFPHVCVSQHARVCVCDFLRVSVTCECALACVCFDMRVDVCDLPITCTIYLCGCMQQRLTNFFFICFCVQAYAKLFVPLMKKNRQGLRCFVSVCSKTIDTHLSHLFILITRLCSNPNTPKEPNGLFQCKVVQATGKMKSHLDIPDSMWKDAQPTTMFFQPFVIFRNNLVKSHVSIGDVGANDTCKSATCRIERCMHAVARENGKEEQKAKTPASLDQNPVTIFDLVTPVSSPRAGDKRAHNSPPDAVSSKTTRGGGKRAKSPDADEQVSNPVASKRTRGGGKQTKIQDPGQESLDSGHESKRVASGHRHARGGKAPNKRLASSNRHGVNSAPTDARGVEDAIPHSLFLSNVKIAAQGPTIAAQGAAQGAAMAIQEEGSTSPILKPSTTRGRMVAFIATSNGIVCVYACMHTRYSF